MNPAESAHRLRLKYPDHVPVVVEVMASALSLKIRKQKFIVHRDTMVGSFCHVVRKYLDGVTSSMALFYYYEDPRDGKVLSPLQQTVGELDAIFSREKFDSSTSERISSPPAPVLTLWVASESAFG